MASQLQLAISWPRIDLNDPRVLRDVGLVRMRCNGRQKLYQTNADGIRPLHAWTSEFERYWRHQLNRVKERAEKRAAEGASVADKIANHKEEQ